MQPSFSICCLPACDPAIVIAQNVDLLTTLFICVLEHQLSGPQQTVRCEVRSWVFRRPVLRVLIHGKHLGPLFSVFGARLEIREKRLIAQSCPSFCPFLQLDGLSWNFVFGISFTKICLENWNLVKTGQKLLFMKSYVHYWLLWLVWLVSVVIGNSSSRY